MNTPILTVIIPTIGRQTLEDTIQSIRLNGERISGDGDIEILVIGDTYLGTYQNTLDRAKKIADMWASTYVEYDGGIHCYGHPQRNYGIKIANGDWLAWMQDDDVWLPGAVEAIMQSISTGNSTPRLFRTHTWQAGIVWKRQELVVGNIDADCIVTPNMPGKVAEWTNRYEGDFDFILNTCKRWGMNVRWEEFVIARGRPNGR